MITWGISANSHNAALAVFNDDDLVFAGESERYSKIKNDADLHHDLIEDASKFGDPDQIVWYENPYKKMIRQLWAGQGWKYKENNIKRYLSNYDINKDVIYSDHHRSHAAGGYYTSGFNDATVICIDSIGEFETLTVWQGKGSRLKKIYSQGYPHSVGLWYSAMTQRIGLKPNEEEYILMGMAAYGDSNRLKKQILHDFFNGNSWPKFKINLHKGCKWWRPDLCSEQDMFDIAAATQAVYEDQLRKILSLSAELNRSDNLVLMGGCALNCSANTMAFEHYKNVWIMPAPGDNGSAIGAVLALKQRHIEWPGPFLGHDLGYCTDNQSIVTQLTNSKICGLARGRAEFGPRALGNRSLIADPRDPDIRDRVNEIKQRQMFRPFAPAILEEFADRYFEMPTKRSPYMQYAVRCLRPDQFPGIVHKDGTSRVQTVSERDNPEFRDLLEKWFLATGCPMLLNTSLNIRGEPMVNDHADLLTWEQKYGLPIFN